MTKATKINRLTNQITLKNEEQPSKEGSYIMLFCERRRIKGLNNGFPLKSGCEDCDRELVVEIRGLLDEDLTFENDVLAFDRREIVVSPDGRRLKNTNFQISIQNKQQKIIPFFNVLLRYW